MKIDCPKRTQRQAAEGARVMPRELQALSELIAKAQPITAHQYAAFVDCSLPIAQRSLRKLAGLKLLSIHLTSLNDPNRYCLTPAVRPVLARALGTSPEDYRLLRGLGKVNLLHHDGVVNCFVAITAAIRRIGWLRLEEFLWEYEIRARLGIDAQKGALVPDAVAVVSDHHGTRCALCLEIDGASENPSWIAERKVVGGYVARRLTGTPVLGCSTFVVAMVVPSARRRNRVAEAIWRAGVPEHFWFFAIADELNDRTVLTSAIWWTLESVAGSEDGRLVPLSPFQTGMTKWLGGHTSLGDEMRRDISGV